MASRRTDLHLAQDADADALLTRDPLALLIGMLLDQQVPMEWAFGAPKVLADRMGTDRLDPAAIAAFEPEAFADLAARKPAIHRYPGSMAKRIQQLCAHIVQEYDSDVTAVWSDASSGAELLRRLTGLPGFGKNKAQIFLALLGKQLGVRPDGWRAAAGPLGEDGVRRSVADIRDDTTLAEVREYKQQQKKQAKQATAAS